MRTLWLSTLCLLAGSGLALAQGSPDGSEEESTGRIQYALILPEEKVPETVKETENNPFESAATKSQKEEGSTEENLVRQILLRLPAVGGANGPGGMRVLLGGMRLVEGGDVPSVLPDQQVALRVKAITPTSLELEWIDKKNPNLPARTLTIPLERSPKVRYQLPGQSDEKTGAAASMGSIRRNGISMAPPPPQLGFSAPPPTTITGGIGAPPAAGSGKEVIARAERVDLTGGTEARPMPAAGREVPSPATQETVAKAEPVSKPAVAAAPKAAEPPPAPPPASSDLPEASVLRMLFGNHAAADP
jgi:hypothetical protein